jgi:hypothetical protein
MAMVLLGRYDDLKVVAFLDMAKVQRGSENSCSIYHHRSLLERQQENNDTKLQMLVPSLQSITAVFGARYIERRLSRKYDYRTECDSFKKIVEFLAEQKRKDADLSGYVWVLDEIRSREDKKYDADLRDKLGDYYDELHRQDLFRWFFDLYDPGTFGKYEIPGMVLIASEHHLNEKLQRAQDVDRFLKTWQKYRNSKPQIVPSKSLGPCSWPKLANMRNLLRLAALVASVADGEVGIARSIQVHRDFFDIAPLAHPDKTEAVEALQNFSAALGTEMGEWTASAEQAPGPLKEAAINLETQLQASQLQKNKAEEALDAMRKALHSGSVNARLVNTWHRRVKDICRDAGDVQNELRRAFEQVESTAAEGLATLFRGGRLRKR